jgi:flagellar biosynthesis/type III secretory pathway protein FliH
MHPAAVLTGTLDLSIHEARMFALASIREAPADRYRRYVHLIRIFTPRHARKELEQLMEDLFKDPFIDRFVEEGMQQGILQGIRQGMQQGMQLGRAEGAARVLLTILAARGIAKADQARTRISECTDPDLLERWAARAATCSTIDEVFAL